MQVQEILTAAIVFVPVAYAALLTVQFASGLAQLGKRPSAPATTPIAPVEPQSASVEQIPDAIEAEGYCPAVIRPIAASIAPVVPADWCTYTDADQALVESAWITHYCNAGLEDVIVSFQRPVRAPHKRQQAHPALEQMTLRAMRQLGAELKIRGARRWNTVQARQTLAEHYSKNLRVS